MREHPVLPKQKKGSGRKEVGYTLWSQREDQLSYDLGAEHQSMPEEPAGKETDASVRSLNICLPH